MFSPIHSKLILKPQTKTNEGLMWIFQTKCRNRKSFWRQVKMLKIPFAITTTINKKITVRRIQSNQGWLFSQGTFGNVWWHFKLSQMDIGIYQIEVRGTATNLACIGCPFHPQQERFIPQTTGQELRNPDTQGQMHNDWWVLIDEWGFQMIICLWINQQHQISHTSIAGQGTCLKFFSVSPTIYTNQTWKYVP